MDNRTTFMAIIVMASVVMLSNVLVQFYLGAFLTYGAFTYPIAFLINDVVNKLEGPKRARQVILWGFVVGVFCSLIGSQIEGEFGPLVTLRIALGSGLAFLIAHLSDTYVFHFFRKLRWWVPPLVPVFATPRDLTFVVSCAVGLVWRAWCASRGFGCVPLGVSGKAPTLPHQCRILHHETPRSVPISFVQPCW